MTPRVQFYYCAAGLGVVWFVYISMSGITLRVQEPIARPCIKYILQWTPRNSPFNLIEEGFDGFLSHNCEFYNCFVTADKNFMPHLTDFDAIAFSGKELTRPIPLPPERAPYQKYIFAATESAHYYRVCDRLYDNYFNWTWTYKINSDFRWGYIKIYDLDGNFVGPKVDMEWLELSSIGDDLKEKLDGKTKGAAWFVSNCKTPGKREEFYHQMKLELSSLNYNWSVDMYGACGPLQCTRSNEKECYKLVEEDYHFYFSFENSFAEDYVTEKLLTALNHYAIPVVYGGANYSRFLPPGSYLNARELGPKALLEKMNEIYIDKEKFYEFFKWRNHYKYEYSLEKDVCDLCRALYDDEKMKPSVYGGLRRWWNDKQWDGKDSTCRFLPPGSYLNARELGPKALLEKMNEIYIDKEKFYEFFKWRNHYKYEYSLEKDVCDLCRALYDDEKMKPSVYGGLRRWWNDKQWDGKDSTCR